MFGFTIRNEHNHCTCNYTDNNYPTANTIQFVPFWFFRIGRVNFLVVESGKNYNGNVGKREQKNTGNDVVY